MKFARETYDLKLVGEMLPLWQAHYKEIAMYQDVPLSPLLELYERAEKQNQLFIFTARNAGALVGYQVFFVSPHPHYSTMVSAYQDLLYLDPELRIGLNGLRFIKWCDEELGRSGTHVVFQHVKLSHNFGPVLKRIGYKEHDMIYSRRLAEVN